MLIALHAAPAGAQDAATETARLLSDLIKLNSVNPPGDTTAVAARLATHFDGVGVAHETIVAPNGKAAHFIARVKGDGSKRPLLIAAHADVVPVEAERWSVDPFSGIIKDGYVWGRGALDNKGSIAVYTMAISRLVKDKTPFARDIIFLAEADEEQGPYHTGWLAENHWAKIDAEFSLNEGGTTLWDARGKVRQVGISYADKVSFSFKIKTKGPTGHSSRPLPIDQTAIGQIVTALGKLQHFSQPLRLMPDTREYFATQAKLNPGPYADAINAMLAATDDATRDTAARRLIALDPEGTADTEGRLRNTLVITMMESGVKPNVIPGHAEAVLNGRLFPKESIDTFIADVQRTIDNPNIVLEIISGPDGVDKLAYYRQRTAIPASPFDTALYNAIGGAATKVWPGAAIMPMVLTGSTDAVPWRERNVPVYGIGAIPILADEWSTVHGDNERVSVKGLEQGVKFVTEILKRVAAK